MKTVIESAIRAPAGALWSPTCFDSQIGKPVKINVEGHGDTTGVLLAATVSKNLQEAALTIQIDDDGLMRRTVFAASLAGRGHD